MLAAHLLAALLCGLWLAYGERAAFRVLRAVAGWLAAPLRLPLASPRTPHRPPRVRVRRAVRSPCVTSRAARRAAARLHSHHLPGSARRPDRCHADSRLPRPAADASGLAHPRRASGIGRAHGCRLRPYPSPARSPSARSRPDPGYPRRTSGDDPPALPLDPADHRDRRRLVDPAPSTTTRSPPGRSPPAAVTRGRRAIRHAPCTATSAATSPTSAPTRRPPTTWPRTRSCGRSAACTGSRAARRPVPGCCPSPAAR